MADNPIRTINWGMGRHWKRIPILKCLLRKTAKIENVLLGTRKFREQVLVPKWEQKIFG